MKKYCSGCRNLDDQAMSDRPNCMDSNAMLQVVAENLFNIRQAQHLTVQKQKHPELLNSISCYQNVAKFLTLFSFIGQEVVTCYICIVYFLISICKNRNQFIIKEILYTLTIDKNIRIYIVFFFYLKILSYFFFVFMK